MRIDEAATPAASAPPLTHRPARWIDHWDAEDSSAVSDERSRPTQVHEPRRASEVLELGTGGLPVEPVALEQFVKKVCASARPVPRSSLTES